MKKLIARFVRRSNKQTALEVAAIVAASTGAIG